MPEAEVAMAGGPLRAHCRESLPSPLDPPSMKSIVALLVIGSLSLATRPLAEGDQSGEASRAAVADAGDLWRTSRDYVTAAAEQVPEADYSFRPTPDVRTMGELFNHVANSQRMLCATVLGERNAGDASRVTKAEIVAALKASNDYCAKAYAITDADAMRHAVPSDATAQSVLGASRTRLYVLMLNAWHDNEHYGNVVTYMRMKGMVPPSSQPK